MVLDKVMKVRSSQLEFQNVAWTVKFRQRFYTKLLFSDFRPDIHAQFLTYSTDQCSRIRTPVKRRDHNRARASFRPSDRCMRPVYRNKSVRGSMEHK